MLQELSIKKFAIIDDLHIFFSDGLTILSGETGAGKSIIINAVNLLLGTRAMSRLIRTGAENAELEALFKIDPESRTANAMEKHGFDIIDGLLIRRIISRRNRHRIYINGHISTIQVLSSLTENLASISGQHAHQGLLKADQHLLILDQFGGLTSLRNKVRDSVNKILHQMNALRVLQSKKRGKSEKIEFLEFQKKEIIEAGVKINEDIALEKERIILRNGEALYLAIHRSIENLYSGEGAVVERLVEVHKYLEKVCRIDSRLNQEAEAINSAALHIEDIS